MTASQVRLWWAGAAAALAVAGAGYRWVVTPIAAVQVQVAVLAQQLDDHLVADRDSAAGRAALDARLTRVEAQQHIGGK